jgi:hypothetical protein
VAVVQPSRAQTQRRIVRKGAARSASEFSHGRGETVPKSERAALRNQTVWKLPHAGSLAKNFLTFVFYNIQRLLTFVFLDIQKIET